MYARNDREIIGDVTLVPIVNNRFRYIDHLSMRRKPINKQL